MKTSKYLCLLAFVFGFSLSGCNQHVSENNETTKKEVAIDSAKDAWFSCYINQHKWEKSDSLSASFSVRSDMVFLNVNCEYSSVTYKKISLLIPLGTFTNDNNKQMLQLVNDTMLAMITYSFADMDYSSETPIPANHLAFELKPTALVSITKVDTTRNVIDGAFKAYAEDENKKKYAFTHGIFKNVAYKK